jgi:hypothetical protein
MTVDALLAEEFLTAAGGLQVRDSTVGTVVTPGCCAGLEDWHDWAQVLTGDSPWLGHDPGPEVEFVGDDLRVWQDGGPNRYRGRWARVHVTPATPRATRAAERRTAGPGRHPRCPHQMGRASRTAAARGSPG